MKYRILISPKAAQDYEEQLAYRLKHEGKARKDKIKSSIRKGLSSLSQDPERYAIIFKNSDIDIRKMSLNKSYSILYTISGNEIVILRIWHNSKNPEELDWDTA